MSETGLHLGGRRFMMREVGLCAGGYRRSKTDSIAREYLGSETGFPAGST